MGTTSGFSGRIMQSHPPGRPPLLGNAKCQVRTSEICALRLRPANLQPILNHSSMIEARCHVCSKTGSDSSSKPFQDRTTQASCAQSPSPGLPSAPLQRCIIIAGIAQPKIPRHPRQSRPIFPAAEKRGHEEPVWLSAPGDSSEDVVSLALVFHPAVAVVSPYVAAPACCAMALLVRWAAVGGWGS